MKKQEKKKSEPKHVYRQKLTPGEIGEYFNRPSGPAIQQKQAKEQERQLEYYYEKRPSWRRYGTGTAYVKLSLEADGSLLIRAGEFTTPVLNGRIGGKEVIVELPAEQVRRLYNML